MAAYAATDRRLIRDPILVLPAVVAAGLLVGRIGGEANVPRARIATDLALAWALAAAFVVVAERPHWRRAAWALAAAAFAVLGADLEWSTSQALWTPGFLLEGLWVALLIGLVLAASEGWSAPATVALALVVTLGAQVAGVFFTPDSRDALSVAPHEGVAHAIDRVQEIAAAGLSVVVLVLVLRRLRTAPGVARRSQGLLLVATAFSALVGFAWVGWVIASDGSTTRLETITRATAVSLPVGVLAAILWSRLRQPRTSDLVVELRTEGATSLRQRLAHVLGDPTLEVAYRLDDDRYVDAAGQPLEIPQDPKRAVTLVTARSEVVAALLHDPALLDEPALVESVQATAGLVL